MNYINLKVKKLKEKAILPTLGSKGAAGSDLYACLDNEIEIKPGETYFVPTGLSTEFEEGFVMLIFARSGLSCKQGLAPANKVGVVDADYRGEIMVALHNHSKETRKVAPGDKIAQFVMMPYYFPIISVEDDLSETERGAGSFGSTGK